MTRSRKLTPRGRALRWLKDHRGLTEQPPGSNTDERKDGIRAAQVLCANGGNWLVRQPWCGSWCFAALDAAGVKDLTSRLASVALIEADAKARAGCFAGWTDGPALRSRKRAVRRAAWGSVRRGDLVVLFGHGVHVAVLRSDAWTYRRLGLVVTDEGNTSPGDSGSQANGGGSFRRVRRVTDIRGIARVDYPNK